METFNKHNTEYVVVDKVGDYTIIKRDTNFQPWIAAYGYDSESHSWIQGYYCNTLESAIYTAKGSNFWSRDWNIKNRGMYVIAVYDKDYDITEAFLSLYDAEREMFDVILGEEWKVYTEDEVLAVIPVADTDGLRKENVA